MIFDTFAVPDVFDVIVSFVVIEPLTFFNFKIFLSVSKLTIVPVAPPEKVTVPLSINEPAILIINTLLKNDNVGAGLVS